MSRYINDNYKNLVELSKFPIGWFLPAGVIEIVEDHNKKYFKGVAFHKSLTTMIVEHERIDQLEKELESCRDKISYQEMMSALDDEAREKLKKEIERLKSRLVEEKNPIEADKPKKNMKIEPNIYKDHLRYRVEILVNGFARSGRFDTLEEAKSFKEKCISERNDPRFKPVDLQHGDDLKSDLEDILDLGDEDLLNL